MKYLYSANIKGQPFECAEIPKLVKQENKKINEMKRPCSCSALWFHALIWTTDKIVLIWIRKVVLICFPILWVVDFM